MKKLSLSILIFLVAVVSVTAQNSNDFEQIENGTNKKTSQIYIETDPTALFFNGFSFEVRRSSTLAKKLNIGVGIYKADLPDFFIEDNPDHIGKGWKAKSAAIGVSFDYHIFDPNKGISTGIAFSMYKFTIERNNKEASYNSLGVTIRVGYLWRPFKKFDSLYVFPWVGLSNDEKISGTNIIDGEKFETPQVSIVPSFQIGFSF